MKNIKITALLTVILCQVWAVTAQTWIQSDAPNKSWGSIASAADGKRLIAVANPQAFLTEIYISTNSGQNWVSNCAIGMVCNAAASSADGKTLVVAGVSTGKTNGLYISTNSAASWTRVPLTNTWWSAVAMSADGRKLFVTESSDEIIASTNFGASWIPLPAAPALSGGTQGGNITSSADGTRLITAPFNGSVIYASTNSGTSWFSKKAYNMQWLCLAASADASTIVAATAYEFSINQYTNRPSIYASVDGGATWITNVFANTADIRSLACSADGKKLFAALYSDHILVSTNFGATWAATDTATNHWESICSSADGGTAVATVIGGGIWVSQSTPSPQLKIAPSGDSLNLSWLIPSTNLVLQQNPGMVGAIWSDVTNTPALNFTNLQNEVILPVSVGSGFYRLKTP